MALLQTASLTTIVLSFLFFLRLISILPRFRKRRPEPKRRGDPSHVLVVLGSGGHTAEMLLLLRDLDTALYTFRRYVISSGDNFSAQKAVEFEQTLAYEAQRAGRSYGSFDIKTVPRARKIHQSLLSTPVSAASSMWSCIAVLRSMPIQKEPGKAYMSPYPDLIMANGPATATIMIFASLLLRFVGLSGANKRMRCIYVESWARVKTPSLSGKILAFTGACDRLLVQWSTLGSRGFEYKGQMVA